MKNKNEMCCRKRDLLTKYCSLSVALLFLFGASCNIERAQDENDLSTLTILQQGSDRYLHGYGNLYAHLLYFLPLAQQTPEGDFKGALAERWVHSEDYREWTFFLRKNIRWHDGVPFTARDIAYSIEFYKHPDVLEWSPATSYTVIDDFTIRIRYPRPLFSPDSWYSYFPEHILGNLDISEYEKWDFWYQPVGNGPYRYVRHVPNTMVELEANPDFFDGKPKIEKVVIKFAANSIVELLSGNVQVADVNLTDIPKLESDGRFNFYYMEDGKGTAIFWNHAHPFFNDPRVRRALTLALDRRTLFDVLSLSDQYPVDVIFTEGQKIRGEVQEGLSYDPEAAKQLLAEAGFLDSDNDGILERDGKPFHFTALLQRGGHSFQYASIFAQSAFRKIGVKMDLSYLPSAVMRPKILKGDFEAFFDRATRRADSNLKIFGPKSTYELPWRGWIGTHHIRIYSILEEATRATNPEQTDAAYRNTWKVFQEEIPLTYLYPLVFYIAADKRVRGLSSPYGAQFPTFLDRIWLQEED